MMERKTIGIVGLGLMGGSLSMALKAAGHAVLGTDIDESTLQYALLTGAIDGKLTEENLASCNDLFIALYPAAAVAWLEEHAALLCPKTVVVDLCGVKRAVCGPCFRLAKEYGFAFVGGHPMAGRQFSGLKYARADLYRGATMLLVPRPGESLYLLSSLRELLLQAGFARVTTTTAEKHDEMIAFTSQLAHVVSSAYVKSPAARQHKDFSAGSFRDLTRVARLNEDMWTELFLENADCLGKELNGLIDSLTKYRDALAAGEEEALRALLREGREIKEEIDAP